MSRVLLTTLLLTTSLLGCGGTGTARFTVYGEELIEQGIPAAELADGWAVDFTRFLIVIGEVQLSHRDGTVAGRQLTPRVFDLVRPGPAEVEVFTEVTARRWDEVSFAIAPAPDATAATTATADDVALMRSLGASIHVEGSAVRDAETRSFAWTFTSDTLYDACQSEGTEPGVVVPVGGEEIVELTIHGDHLVYDDLVGDRAELRFDAIAAADRLPADGVVTLEELAAVDLTELPADQYGTGNASGVRSLRDFVETVVRTLGHFRGEGECRVTAR